MGHQSGGPCTVKGHGTTERRCPKGKGGPSQQSPPCRSENTDHPPAAAGCHCKELASRHSPGCPLLPGSLHRSQVRCCGAVSNVHTEVTPALCCQDALCRPLLRSLQCSSRSHAQVIKMMEVKLKPVSLRTGLLKEGAAPVLVRGPGTGYGAAQPPPHKEALLSWDWVAGVMEEHPNFSSYLGRPPSPFSSSLSALCLYHALPFQRTWACVRMGTARDRCWPETSGRSDSPASFAAAGVQCSPASQPGEERDTGGRTEKAGFTSQFMCWEAQRCLGAS